VHQQRRAAAAARRPWVLGAPLLKKKTARAGEAP